LHGGFSVHLHRSSFANRLSVNDRVRHSAHSSRRKVLPQTTSPMRYPLHHTRSAQRTGIFHSAGREQEIGSYEHSVSSGSPSRQAHSCCAFMDVGRRGRCPGTSPYAAGRIRTFVVRDAQPRRLTNPPAASEVGEAFPGKSFARERAVGRRRRLTRFVSGHKPAWPGALLPEREPEQLTTSQYPPRGTETR